MTRYRIAGAVLCVLALGTTGCSNGNDVDEPTTSSTTAPANGPPPDTGEPGVGPAESEPVATGESVDVGNGVLVTITNVEAADLAAKVAGETAGPGLIVTVEVRNGSDADVDLVGFVVNARFGPDATPASPNYTAVEDRLEGTVPPGGTAVGRYAFRVPTDELSTTVVLVELAGGSTIAVIEVGDAVNDPA